MNICIKTLYSSFPYNSNGRRPLRLTFFYAAPAAAIITAPTWDPCRLPIATMSREKHNFFDFDYCHNVKRIAIFSILTIATIMSRE